MDKRSFQEFRKITNEYDKGRRRENTEFWANETRKIGDLNSESIILDLGCGTGLYTVVLGKSINAIMCGLDPVSEMLKQARNKSKKAFWINAVGEYLPFRSKTLDCIFSSQVWHHIKNKQRTANECGSVLKEKGSTIIRTIGHDQLHNKVVFKYFPEIKANQLKVYPSNKEFKNYFRKAGFRRVRFYEYNLERYQEVDELIEIAEKKLWSMFRPISQEGLKKGIRELRKYYEESGGKAVRNDEMIILVVSHNE
jgi:ubiquinone/menaquinone biosynthesis C-methylase UbiE